VAELAKLEAALAANWDRDLLAVYGDYLQSIGDPRGELIAIDLAGKVNELAARRHELFAQWLGEDLATIVLHVGAVDHGFVRLGHRAPQMATFAVREILAHPAGTYLRALSLVDRGASPRVYETLDLLGDAPRPWICSMRVVAPTEPADAARLERAIAAMPLLRELELLELDPSVPVKLPAQVRVSHPS
jgi:hypothetical protein